MQQSLRALVGWQETGKQSDGPAAIEYPTTTLLRVLRLTPDWSRIRQCPECSRLFVAVPEFKATCSAKCSQLHRVHKFMSTHPGYYARKERTQRAVRRRKCARKEKKS